METLMFCVRGEWYTINEKGEFLVGTTSFSPTWKFLGVSTHHWHQRIIHPFEELWNNPELGKKGYVWDLDHGYTRLCTGRRISFIYKGQKP